MATASTCRVPRRCSIPGSPTVVTCWAAAFAQLGIHKDIGDELTEPERTHLIDCWVGLLEAAAVGDLTQLRDTPIEQVPFHLPADAGDPIITLSGGVGELVYAYVQGAP